ncbi:hypothetical protein ACIHJG_35225 [Streptomyces sp. NPDC052415]|uniref:hypothetical protein n=1 Tax=Streptomyces sp. NPDC052415 TaxID=3365690 RepID=UPI0037D82575
MSATALPTRFRPARSRTAPAAVLLGIGLLLGAQPHATAQPSPAATADNDGAQTQPPIVLDGDDPVLALAEGATLAAPKILDLGLTRLSIHHLVVTQRPGGQSDTAASPRPSTSATAGRQPAQRPSETASTPKPTASASLLPPPSSSKAHPPTPAPSTPPAAAPTSGDPAPRTLVGAGALLAALFTALLALRLHRRRSRTARTHRAHLPASLLAQATRQAGTARSDLVRLDAALRILAHRHRGPTPPAVQAALVTTNSVHVLPHEHTPAPPAPFTEGPGTWWVLPDDAVLLDEDEAPTIPAPCPGLVTLGTTTDGGLLLLNMADHRALLLTGSPDHIIEVCTSLSLETLTSPWAGATDIWTVGFADDLPQALPHPSLTHLPHAGLALRALSERLLEIHQQPPGHPVRPLLICAPTLSPTTAGQIADLLDKSDQAAVTLIAPRRSAETLWPDAELLDATLSGPQHLHCTDTDITLQRLPHADYRQIIQTLTDCGGPDARAEQPQHTGPDARAERAQRTGPDTPNNTPHMSTTSGRPDDSTPQPEPPRDDDAVFPALLPSGPVRAKAAAPPATQPAAGHGSQTPTGAHDEHAPELRVLGPVEMDHVTTTGHGPRQAQLAALLYFHPGRSADTLCTHMDPARPWTKRTLNARLQGLRHALGDDPAGNPYVPRRQHADDPYHLSPHIRCDWTHFRTLTDHAHTPGPGPVRLPDLEQALFLVRGRPFGPRPLPWQEPLQQEMTTRIIAVAHTIALHRTADGPHHNLTAARQAIATGLDLDDSAEILYRDWMRIETAAGNRQGLHTALTRLQHISTTLDFPLEKATEDLIHQLLHHSGPDTAPHTSPHR